MKKLIHFYSSTKPYNKLKEFGIATKLQLLQYLNMKYKSENIFYFVSFVRIIKLIIDAFGEIMRDINHI